MANDLQHEPQVFQRRLALKTLSVLARAGLDDIACNGKHCLNEWSDPLLSSTTLTNPIVSVILP